MVRKMPVKNSKQTLGAIGEKIAQDFLIDNNYKILMLNYRFSRMGEIDIIAREKEYICFIEVKTRRNTLFGMPSEAVDKRKQARMIKLAYIYLKAHNIKDGNVRFDIVEILYKGQNDYSINLIENAF
jgi:putative endonuclease